MNIIRQAGASIGTAILSVILASTITSNLPLASAHTSSSGSGGLSALQHLPARAHAVIAGPLAAAFASTFIWALVMIVIALIPAGAMALSGRRAGVRGSVAAPQLAVE